MKKRFTLVELLVVIAIIAILASMMMPALAKARDMAMGTKCLANINNTGKAATFYSEDFRGKLFTKTKDDSSWGMQFAYRLYIPFDFAGSSCAKFPSAWDTSFKVLKGGMTKNSTAEPSMGLNGFYGTDNFTALAYSTFGIASSAIPAAFTGSRHPDMDKFSEAAAAGTVAGAEVVQLDLRAMNRPGSFILFSETGLGADSKVDGKAAAAPQSNYWLFNPGMAYHEAANMNGAVAFNHGLSTPICFADGSTDKLNQDELHYGTMAIGVMVRQDRSMRASLGATFQ